MVVADWQFFGSGLVVLFPPAIGLVATAFLLWRMLNPTQSVLVFGTIYWILQIVSVQLPGGLYEFHFGLTVDVRLTDNPNYVVEVNLLALVIAIMFGIAAARRSATDVQPVVS